MGFPFTNVSLLKGEGNIISAKRVDLYNRLWGTGRFPEETQVGEKIVRGRISTGSISVYAVSYFVDLLSLDKDPY